MLWYVQVRTYFSRNTFLLPIHFWQDFSICDWKYGNYYSIDLSQSKCLITESLRFIILSKELLWQIINILKNLRWFLKIEIFLTWQYQFWIRIPVIESDQTYEGKDTGYELIKITVYKQTQNSNSFSIVLIPIRMVPYSIYRFFGDAGYGTCKQYQ